jgi:hypothetical protein
VDVGAQPRRLDRARVPERLHRDVVGDLGEAQLVAAPQHLREVERVEHERHALARDHQREHVAVLAAAAVEQRPEVAPELERRAEPRQRTVHQRRLARSLPPIRTRSETGEQHAAG